MAPSFSESIEDTTPFTSAKASTLPNSGPTFQYTSTTKLRNAQHQVAHDFRSDVVTVPTESMMQVGAFIHFYALSIISSNIN